MGKIIGYCRVSSKKQLNEGNSLEIQESTIKEKYKDAIIYKEQYTGKTTNRPVFDEICKSLEKGDTLVVTKLDRLCRNVNEGSSLIANLREKGVSIHIMNMALIEEGPVGDLMMNMLLGFAQFERDMIIARTTEGRERAKANGVKFGRKEKFTKAQLNDALSKLNINGGTLTYKDIEREYKISKSTLIRYKNKVEADRVRGERTQKGREISKKTNPDYVEERPNKFTDTQLINACKDLKINGGTKSYKEVMEEHKMSKDTIISANNKFFPKKLTPSENFYKNIEDTINEYYKN